MTTDRRPEPPTPAIVISDAVPPGEVYFISAHVGPGGVVSYSAAKLVGVTTAAADGAGECARCRELGKLGADGMTGDPEADAARRAYEKAWPGRCWFDAPADVRRSYIEVAVLRAVEDLRAGRGGQGSAGR